MLRRLSILHACALRSIEIDALPAVSPKILPLNASSSTAVLGDDLVVAVDKASTKAAVGFVSTARPPDTRALFVLIATTKDLSDLDVNSATVEEMQARFEAMVVERLVEAATLRTNTFPIRSKRTLAFRWVNGIGDGLPGLYIDVAGTNVFVRTANDGAKRHFVPILEKMLTDERFSAVRTRCGAEGFTIKRLDTAETCKFRELGVLYKSFAYHKLSLRPARSLLQEVLETMHLNRDPLKHDVPLKVLCASASNGSFPLTALVAAKKCGARLRISAVEGRKDHLKAFRNNVGGEHVDAATGEDLVALIELEAVKGVQLLPSFAYDLAVITIDSSHDSNSRAALLESVFKKVAPEGHLLVACDHKGISPKQLREELFQSAARNHVMRSQIIASVSHGIDFPVVPGDTASPPHTLLMVVK